MRLKGRLIQGDSCEMRSITVHPQEWNDVNMRWNISDYGGVKDLRIPPHRLWKPDVLMYNSLSFLHLSLCWRLREPKKKERKIEDEKDR
ncbi:hypothetical protein HZH68_009027 [Vespula germanica]|uniref:Neurotransmitter-gated ion-channel ligand-binding domain-containing protein n=1 Tax=Vespula germanica TaxID=30212 RepID=A0A834N6S3_VESGE|nr:hypothetical protein HZH68_009027 [Vespula germanica]